MTESDVIKLLTAIANKIGYRFNSVLTNKKKQECHWRFPYILTSDNGLQIRVYIAKDILTQWKLGYVERTFHCCSKIGSSLNKPIPTIAADIKRRLLCDTASALESKAKVERKTFLRNSEKEMQEHFINAVKSQFSIKPSRHQRYTNADFAVQNINGDRVGHFLFTMDKPNFEPKISLSLSNITSQQLFEILNIVTQPKSLQQ